MINGYLQADENGDLCPMVDIVVRGFGGESVQFAALIGTGFSGAVGLRPEDAQTLNLMPSGSATTTLADDSQKVTDTYFAVVDWDGVSTLTEVIADDAVPLVGMKLLTGYNLSVDVTDGGTVEITRLVPRRVAATEPADVG